MSAEQVIPPTPGKKSPAGKNGSSSSNPDWQLMYCTIPKRILAPPLSFKGKLGGPQLRANWIPF